MPKASSDPWRWIDPQQGLFGAAFPELAGRPCSTPRDRDRLIAEARGTLVRRSAAALAREGVRGRDAADHLCGQFIERMTCRLVERFEENPDPRFISRTIRLMAKEYRRGLNRCGRLDQDPSSGCRNRRSS